MFGRESDLKMHVQNLGYLYLKNRGPKATYFRRFSTTSQLNCKFDGPYLRSETRYRQSVNDDLKYVVNFYRRSRLTLDSAHARRIYYY